MTTFNIFRVAEVKLSYTTKIKASERPKIDCSKAAYDIFHTHWNNAIEHTESTYLLLLNQANRVLGISILSNGGTTGCIVDPRIIFQLSLKSSASNIILAHNHPSGNVKPSDADLSITRKIKDGGKLLEINLLDHIILTAYDGYYSMADEGFI